MMSHPHIQIKAQHELDTILPPGVLPTLQDMENLPYVTALVRETLRWKPITPFGLDFSRRQNRSKLS
jgi:cytochrome P450